MDFAPFFGGSMKKLLAFSCFSSCWMTLGFAWFSGIPCSKRDFEIVLGPSRCKLLMGHVCSPRGRQRRLMAL